MVEKLAQYGAIGICLVVAIGFIYYLLKRIEAKELTHAAERREWKATSDKQFEVIAAQGKEDATILTKLTSLLESRKHG